MRTAAALLLVCCAGACLAASQPLRVERLWLFGKEYYRLTDWARVNGLQVKWLSKTEVQAADKTIRLTFTVDSRKMSLNGTIVWLSHAVAGKDGVAYISPVDVTTALAPILWPTRNSRNERVRHICIDAGHGGKDPGNREGKREEKTYTLLLASELAAQLRKAGFTVSFTRTTDAYVDLDARPDIARRKGADLFLSLHFNSGAKTSYAIGGAEVYCLTPPKTSSTNARGAGANTGAYKGNRNDSRNALLAYELQKAIVRGTDIEDRGVKRARFAVLRSAPMPAALIEAGFMSNPREAKKIYDAAWRKKMAQAIVSGIRNYRSAVEK
jgi:N-acetylmuramoyl-L-alanine amidase